MTRQSEMYQVFEKENLILEHAKEILGQPDAQSPENMRQEYEKLTKSYAQLLSDVKLLTSVSDRLQNKLNKANENIAKKNQELTETIDMLTRARAGKRATTIVLLLGALFFVFSEWVIDPQLQSQSQVFGSHGIIALKLVVALALKPLEMLLENFMLKTAVKTKK